ncbi:MAG TPA: hypothetical protein VFH97_09130 [Gemmatimonadales bacterium]|nr:hypothetical protein [Gemmatimonadales bacterium]
MRLLALASLPFLVSCWWRSDPAPATPILPEVVFLTPDTARYRVVEHERTEQTVNGGPLAVGETRTTWLTATLAAADSGLAAAWALDSVVATGDREAAGPFAPGIAFHGTMDRDGRVTGLDAGRADSLATAPITDLLGRFYPVMRGGARPGAAWEDTTEILTGRGVLLRGRSVNRRSVSAWTTWAGVPALEIAVTSDYTLAGSGRISGQLDVAIEGTGRRHARRYVDSRGRYLGGMAADTADLEARVAGTGLVIPIRRMSADTVEAGR